MRNIYLIAITFFLSSCTTLEYELGIQSDIEKEGNAQIILDQLNDSELRKGKVFVFSNIRNGLFHYVRVNETERYMRDQEVQVFDLIDGKNNIFAFLTAFGDEVYNCNGEEFVFTTKDFPEYETFFFMVVEAAESEFAGRKLNCFKEFHLTEEGFFYIKDNPRSQYKPDWFLNL
tara:strand:- start:52 stop:573 length:522 start_codon:yes stop_codon:yes gene_type:complete